MGTLKIDIEGAREAIEELKKYHASKRLKKAPSHWRDDPETRTKELLEMKEAAVPIEERIARKERNLAELRKATATIQEEIAELKARRDVETKPRKTFSERHGFDKLDQPASAGEEVGAW